MNAEPWRRSSSRLLRKQLLLRGQPPVGASTCICLGRAEPKRFQDGQSGASSCSSPKRPNSCPTCRVIATDHMKCSRCTTWSRSPHGGNVKLHLCHVGVGRTLLPKDINYISTCSPSDLNP